MPTQMTSARRGIATDEMKQVAKDEATKAREAYSAEMAKKGATLPKGFIKDAKANTGH